MRKTCVCQVIYAYESSKRILRPIRTPIALTDAHCYTKAAQVTIILCYMRY